MRTTTSASPAAAPLKLPWFPWVGKRPYYGWVIVIIGGLTQFAQGITSQAFGTYFAPLQKEFGWSRAVLAGPRSITSFENAILGPIEGYLVDRLGPRVMVAIGTVIMGAGLVLFGMTNSLWMYYLSNILIAAGTGFQGLLVLSIAVNHWFRRKRTIANAVMLLGFATAGIIGVPAVVFIQTSMGWRTSAVLTGIFVWAVGLPLSMLLRRSPEPFGLLPDVDISGAQSTAPTAGGRRVRRVVEEYDFTLREALRNRTFWLLSIGQAIGGLGMGAAGTHLFLHLEQGVGLARTTAALVWTVASITNIPCRLIGGFIGDRLPKHLILGATSVLMSISTLVLGLATSFQMALVYAVIYGIGWGARTPVMNAIQGEYFGRKHQGKIRGWLSVIMLPIGISVPVLVGYFADVQGTYKWIFIVMAFIGVAGSTLIFMATPPKHPVRADAT